MASRPIIIGLDSPRSAAPEHALYPYPVGCTGWRLWMMLRARCGNVSMREYLETFDRRNLATTRGVLSARSLAGRRVLLLGQIVARAFGLDGRLIHPVAVDGAVFRVVPHPSGRNPWYRNRANAAMVSMILEELYMEARGDG